MKDDAALSSLIQCHRKNRANVARLEHKVDELVKTIKSLATALDIGNVEPVADGTLLTPAGPVSGDSIPALAEAMLELRQAQSDLALSQSRVDRLGI